MVRIFLLAAAIGVAAFFVPGFAGLGLVTSVALFVLGAIAIIRGWVDWAHIESRAAGVATLVLATGLLITSLTGAVHLYEHGPPWDPVTMTVTGQDEEELPAGDSPAEPEDHLPEEPQPAPEPAAPVAPPAQPDPEPEVRYASCSEVEAAGAAPIRVGEPGYSSKLDGDGDGIACEP